MTDFRRELDAAKRAAGEAATLIRARAQKQGTREVKEKGLHDLVTDVDVLSQNLIVRILSADFPEYGFLLEESSDEPVLEKAERRWIIDPIDGTTNFAHGVPPYAVSIALAEGSDIVVGVVMEVVSGELFSAAIGGGSCRNGERIHVSRSTHLGESLVSTGFPYRSVGHLDRYLESLGSFMQRCRGVRRHGSASIDLAYLACGRFDGFFETGLNPWDVAAGVLLVREAGGRVTQFSGSGDPVFAGQILGSNGLIHDDMQRVVAPLLDVFS